MPATFLLGAYCWQLLPHRIGLMLSRWRFVFIALTLPLGLLAAWAIGPLAERAALRRRHHGLARRPAWQRCGGWMILFLPLCGVGSFFVGREVNTWLRRAAANLESNGLCLGRPGEVLRRPAGLSGGRLAILSWLMTSLGWDPRGSFVGTYDQRNALVVGFVMGFAIIPIIYTIADDALSTVPEHLRSAAWAPAQRPGRPRCGSSFPRR